ncbi:LysM peptidoglycan-binding domain-containing M23 family metallopeptidase [Defluviimonas sp. WL0024]|uniref:LysM peptidoglycan-binding domain-containing M23 family metallopeptidase n=1 Tax=Albidovulum salinarum TaxID=2984153 RepID=A0ABT2WZJ1_9RHOB|nr:M23 family metallopeptidase [Defluviimonas sp. WL0024]MCU9847091.1 LysM peptidoglycan-binding domain-containing M23 family metallopeptidase [Defluviimonas sp. WL0024]
MTTSRPISMIRVALLGTSLVALAACEPGGGFDPDLRNYSQIGLDTSAAAMQASAARPTPDARGIISYPNYQVAVARRGDTVDSVAARVGLPAAELASYNALQPGMPLREGEIVALPRRVAGAAPAVAAPVYGAPATGAPATASGGRIDVTTIASGALDRASATSAPQPAAAAPAPAAAPVTATEPVRHRVQRGETAYSVARLYNVDVKALADWNGLGPDLGLREGQTLLIPVANATRPAPVAVTAPGQGSPTPTPPSAAKPLPAEKTTPTAAPVKTPPPADLGAEKTAASTGSKLAMPVQGKIIRGYQKKKNEGIDISASAGSSVTAAGDGTVAAITKDTEQVPILVIRHEGNLLTVYANIDGIAVAKGAKVSRGQTIAKVRSSDPAFLHFEVRQGFDSVDPMPYLQ